MMGKQELLRGVLGWRTWAKRAALVAGIQARAAAAGASVDLEVAPNVQLDGRVRIYIQPGSTNRLSIGPRARVEDGVYIQLKGGTIEIGPAVEVRRHSVLNVSGQLILEGNNIISYGDVIHCADRIVFEPYAGCSEYVTVADSRHFHSDETTFFYDNVESRPITIGRNAWLANKSSVLMGVRIGELSVVAGHSVVTRDVPPRTIVAGAPAKVIGRTLPPPA